MEKTDMEKNGEMSTHECKMKKRSAALERMDAALSAAYDAEVKAARKSVYVAHMQGFANYFLSELKTCKEDEKSQAEENVAKHNKALADAHAEWTALLNTTEELRNAYRKLADEFNGREKWDDNLMYAGYE